MIDANFLREVGVPNTAIVGVLAVTLLLKLFHASRSYVRQGRKECLELWNSDLVIDSFWLESYFRHMYNVKPPPAELIREGLRAFNPTQVCMELSMNWKFFKGVSLRGLEWRVSWRSNTFWRLFERVVLLTLYLFLVFAGVILWDSAWVLSLFLVFIGAYCFWVFLEIAGATRALDFLREASLSYRKLVGVGDSEAARKGLVGDRRVSGLAKYSAPRSREWG